MEILGELNRGYTPRNAKWLTDKARQLRTQGFYLPQRNYDGLTPTSRRMLRLKSFTDFWGTIDELVGRLEARNFRDHNYRNGYNCNSIVETDLLQLFEGSNMTTDKLIELVPYSRVTLLRRLRALENAGFVTCSLAIYGGRGRGYNWNIN